MSGLDTGRMIEAIYEAAVLPDQWAGVLGEIAEGAGFAGGLVTAAPPIKPELLATMAPRIRWIASPALEPAATRYFAEGWFARCGCARRGMKLAHPGFVADTDLFSQEEMNAEPSYTFFHQYGFGSMAALFLRLPAPSETFIFSFDRWLDEGPVTREMLARLDPLRPHLSRAALISSRLGLERAHSAAQALAILGLPAAVLCPKSRILAANSLLQTMMPNRVVEDGRGRIQLIDKRANTLLERALANVLLFDDSGLDPNRVFSIPIAARDEMPAVVVHVVPIRRRARDIFASAASIMLVTPVSARELPAASVIQGLFDLTAAETRVAQMIAQGETVDRIATHGQISQETVRSHLKSVYSKTGVSRQASLAILLNSTSIRVDSTVN